MMENEVMAKAVEKIKQLVSELIVTNGMAETINYLTKKFGVAITKLIIADIALDYGYIEEVKVMLGVK